MSEEHTNVSVGFKVLEAHTERNQTDREIYVVDTCEIVEVSMIYDPPDPLCRAYRPSWIRKYWWLLALALAILSMYLGVKTLW